MDDKKSLLDQIDADSRLQSGISPFSKKKKTKPLRVRLTYYNEIRSIAFQEDKKMVAVLDDIIKRGIKSYKESHPDTSNKQPSSYPLSTPEAFI